MKSYWVIWMVSAVLLQVFTGQNSYAADDSPTSIVDDVTNSVEDLASDARDQYEWLSKRRTFTIDGVPYGVTGLPMIYYTPNSGLSYRAWMLLSSYKTRPYSYRIMAQWWLTTKGKRNHFVRVELPTFFNTPFSLRIILKDLNGISTSFFGTGNNSERSEAHIDRNKYYYNYRLEEQRTAFDIEGEILGGKVGAFLGLRFNRALPSRKFVGVQSYVFDVDPDVTPNDLNERWINYFALGFLYDTRDDPEFTTSGLLADASVQRASKLLGSNSGFTRYTCIARHYYRFKPKFDKKPYILFNRIIVEHISGDAPFYALTKVGGAVRGADVGGSETLRGFPSLRFADRTKVLSNHEIRRFFPQVTFRRKIIRSQIAFFTDLGRVSPGILAWRPSDIHVSGGIGAILNWNSQMTIRFDFALSPEGSALLFNVGQVF